MSWSWIVNNVLEPSSPLVLPVLLCAAALGLFRFAQFLQRLTQRMDYQEERLSEVIKDFKESNKHLLQRADRQEEQFNKRMDRQEERLSEVIKDFKESNKHLLQRADRQEEQFNKRMDRQEEKFTQRMDRQDEKFTQRDERLAQIMNRQEERFTQRMDHQEEKTSEVTKEAQGTSRDLSALTIKVDKVSDDVNKSITEAGVLSTKGELVYQHMFPIPLQPNAAKSPLALTSIGKKMVSSLDAHKMLDKYLPQLKAWIDEKKIGTAYDIQMHSVHITRYEMLKLLDEDDLVKVKDEAYHRNMPLVVVMEVFATLLRDAVFNDRGMPLPFPKGKAVAKGKVAKKRSK